MAIHIRRREFIGALGGAAAWPLGARAQAKIPRIGLISPGPSEGPDARDRKSVV